MMIGLAVLVIVITTIIGYAISQINKTKVTPESPVAVVAMPAPAPAPAPATETAPATIPVAPTASASSAPTGGKEKSKQEPEKKITNSLGMRFVLVPSGTFMMGSPANEPGRGNDEIRHQATIGKAFYLQTTEVTQGQWKMIMGGNPSYFKNCGDDCPVDQVSWDDAQAFIKKLNGMEGTDKYRLPTEAEWEYAARAGTMTALYNGPINILGDHNAPALDSIAWYGGNSCVDYAGGYDSSSWKEKQYSCSQSGTHPVGKKQANAWGLYDMLGNVWEWVQDLSGSIRVNRGGSWFNNARSCRSAFRNVSTPGDRYYYLGFRLARTQ